MSILQKKTKQTKKKQPQIQKQNLQSKKTKILGLDKAPKTRIMHTQFTWSISVDWWQE